MSINVYLHPTHTTGTFQLQFNLDTRQKVKLYYARSLTNTPARRVMSRHAAHNVNVHQASLLLHQYLTQLCNDNLSGELRLHLLNPDYTLRALCQFIYSTGSIAYSTCNSYHATVFGCRILRALQLYKSDPYCIIYRRKKNTHHSGPGYQCRDSPRAGGLGDRIPMWARLSARVQTGPVANSASYTTGTGSLSGVKWSGRGGNHPPSPSAEVKERVGLYLYSP